MLVIPTSSGDPLTDWLTETKIAIEIEGRKSNTETETEAVAQADTWEIGAYLKIENKLWAYYTILYSTVYRCTITNRIFEKRSRRAARVGGKNRNFKTK